MPKNNKTFVSKIELSAGLLLLSLLALAGCAKEEAGAAGQMKAPDKNAPQDIRRVIEPAPPAPGSAAQREAARANPFLTLEEEASSNTGAAYIPLDIDRLNLSAVIYSPSGNSRAVINGRILEPGNQIDGKEIAAIKAEEVILKDSQNEYVLRLRDIFR